MKYIVREGNEIFNLQQFSFFSFRSIETEICLFVEEAGTGDFYVLERYNFKDLERLAENHAINLQYFTENQSEVDYLELIASRITTKLKKFIQGEDKIFDIEKEILSSIRNDRTLNLVF